MNRIQLIGHVGQDVEFKNLPSGQSVANFSIATNYSYTDKTGKKVAETDWHKITAWGKLAELSSKYLSKGSKVFVAGRSKTTKFEDKDGGKREKTEIILSEIEFLEKNENANSAQNAEAVNNHHAVAEPVDDLPF